MKVMFEGYTYSDLCAQLEDHYSVSELEELMACSDLIPIDSANCEYVVLYWRQLRTFFEQMDPSLIIKLQNLQDELKANDEDLIFVQV